MLQRHTLIRSLAAKDGQLAVADICRVAGLLGLLLLPPTLLLMFRRHPRRDHRADTSSRRL